MLMVRDDRQTCLFVLNIFLFNFHHTENKKKLIDCCRVELKLIQFLRNVTFAQYFDAKHCRLIGTNVFTKKNREKYKLWKIWQNQQQRLLLIPLVITHFVAGGWIAGYTPFKLYRNLRSNQSDTRWILYRVVFRSPQKDHMQRVPTFTWILK